MTELPVELMGFVEIKDRDTGEILVSKTNAIHYENMSHALALSLGNRANGHIHEMVFGNGASTVNGIGAITYFPPNVKGTDARLYNQTYRKVVDDLSPLNTSHEQNFIRVEHVQNTTYSDVVIACTLDYSEPSGQEAFDDATNGSGDFIFDEIGLRSYDPTPGAGRLLTHVVFHPVQKSLNRSIEVVYTVRVLL